MAALHELNTNAYTRIQAIDLLNSQYQQDQQNQHHQQYQQHTTRYPTPVFNPTLNSLNGEDLSTQAYRLNMNNCLDSSSESFDSQLPQLPASATDSYRQRYPEIAAYQEYDADIKEEVAKVILQINRKAYNNAKSKLIGLQVTETDDSYIHSIYQHALMPPYKVQYNDRQYGFTSNGEKYMVHQ